MCPLSGRVMRDPVILLSTGVSYERVELEAHLAQNPAAAGGHNPAFWPNPALRALIETLSQHFPILLAVSAVPPQGPLDE